MRLYTRCLVCSTLVLGFAAHAKDVVVTPASRWNNGIIRIYHARNVRIVGEPDAKRLSGVEPSVEQAKEPFKTKSI